jgi:BirA family biotin operon repressor/biotin-[acetyl-CoA-carboxylase] ligase
MSPADGRLDAEQLRRALGDCTIGHDVLVLEETTSTNDFVFSIANPETPAGIVVFAERQTAGRGQHGKRWESAVGQGLWFSVLLRPQLPLEETPRLTSWAAEVVAATLQAELSLGATVKPPNDVYVGERKVAGVLLEMRAVRDGPHVGILGIGINVNHGAADFPDELRARAASLAMLCGHEVDRQQLAAAVLRRLDHSYAAKFCKARNF